jgi:hypothetical protein
VVFNATFNTIFQLYRGGQIFMVEETGVHVHGEKHRLSQGTDKLYHTMLYRVTQVMNAVGTHNTNPGFQA